MNNSRKEAKPTADWISVEDRLPERGDRYLVILEGGCICILTWVACYWSASVQEITSVTHWMPLPALPGVEMMTNKSPDPVMTATEVVERLEALNAAIRERESTTDKWMDDLAARVAGVLIESVGDDLSPDDLAQIIAIRDGEK